MKNKKGFTLVELLVVIVIIGLLIAIAVPSGLAISKKTKQKMLDSKIEIIESGAIVYGQNNKNEIEPIATSDCSEDIKSVANVTNCKKTTLSVLLQNNALKEDQKDDAGNKVLINPVTNLSINNCEIEIYIKNKRVYARYDTAGINCYDTVYNGVNKELPIEDLNLFEETKKFAEDYIKEHPSTGDKVILQFKDGEITQIDTNGNVISTGDKMNKKIPGEGEIRINPDNEYKIIIYKEDYNLETDYGEEKLEEVEKGDSEFSRDILNLYEEVKKVAQTYINNNTITEEVYFEFKDGDINIVDLYGNKVTNESVIMNNRVLGEGELLINNKNQYQITIYQDSYNIKNTLGTDKLTKETLNHSRDLLLLIKNLERLELLAEKYAGKTKGDYNGYYKKTWLVPFYIRSLSYSNENYDLVTGYDSGFNQEYVSANASYLYDYFNNTKTFTVNKDTIDLRHMMAVLAGIIYNTPGAINGISYDENDLNCLVSWAGDLHEFIQYDIITDTTYSSYANATYHKLGKENTRFSLEDLYADIDPWIFHYYVFNLRYVPENTISKVFKTYYSEATTDSNKSYKYRFTTFDKVMDNVAGEGSNFYGLVKRFTNDEKTWLTLELPRNLTEDEETAITEGFIWWINARIDAEKS